MTATRLQTTGVVVAIGDGNVWISGLESYPGDEGARVPASQDEQRAWASLLMKPGAVRITIEPIEPATVWGPVEVERAKRRILDSLPNYRGIERSISDVMTDAMPEIIKMIAEARR